ncbi:unnamed protein product (macronuclear) [Paramecium tetraurelia]|uniref:Transmembrane protein n=1 Tax=Paramecium tetraurelia TaxID=5888 RepID=A0BY77_PARTE|nr:uncharacterized protein GSPATT00033347001 [Paramecium tetraurelia]CAK63494.1 unnamed protein product [Paramecium tetraurelia]|eukprot:XP_001430892.1 hypothetical protein (macronuclear) [Paramecium tetraurelia strain d4-2]
MEMSKIRKTMMKVKKRTIQALLYISEDGFDLAKSPFFNCCKIVIYFLQLEGYVFSQFESKHLNLSENIYLSNYTQLSPLTFLLLQIGNDILTSFFFYFIFCLHVIVYLTLIKMSLDSDIAKPNYIKKVLNLFFINYQWIFVTPFQEISVGVMVCGKTAFIKDNQFSPNCTSEKNKLFYVFGVLGTLFVSLSGFSISYFFRNYQFYEKTFSRSFSYTNVFRIMLHQLVIILYYINFPGIDFAKHAFQQLLGMSLIYDILVNQPFGYSFEANFYSSATFTHQYFLILTSVWIFSPGLEDYFMFYTFLLIAPLLITLSNQFQKRDQIKICNTFQLAIYNNRADKYLEEIYRTAEESDTSIESKILFIQILNHHIQLCTDNQCSCMLNVQNFFQNNSVDYKQLNLWTTYVFEKCLQLALLNRDYEFYEHLALKYVTFLAKYKNNPINAYTILQQIMNNQQSQNLQIKGRQVQSSSFYFLNIQFILQKRNRAQFQNQNVHHSEQILQLLKGHSIIENIGTLLQQEIRSLALIKQQFWEDYYNNKIQTFQQLLEQLNKMQNQIHTVCTLVKMLRSKNVKKKQLVFDCVSILNLELLFKICSTNNILEIYEIQHQIQQILFLEQQELESFLNFHFQNQQSIGLVSNITLKRRGELWKPNQALLEQYFNVNFQISHLNQLMPPFIADIHDGIIENFIRKGYSYKMEQTSLIFSIYGEGLIQPLQFTLGYFFPKFSSDFEFYLMAFFKKIESNQRAGSTEKSNIGYIYFDINLNVLGVNEVVYTKVFNQQSLDLNKLELCYIIPSVIDSLIAQYHFMIERQVSELVDNDIIMQKQQESFYVPRDLRKIYQINQNCSLKNRLSQLEDIQDDLQKANPFGDLKQYQISYQLFSKIIHYQKGNVLTSKDFFFLKLQFLEEQDNKNDFKDQKDSKLHNQPQNILNTPNGSSITSQSIENAILELGSQRSKSSNQSLLQQSNQFHNQLLNNKNKNITLLFILINLIFAIFFLATFIIISFIILSKFSIGNYCISTQTHVLREISSLGSIVNALNNEQISTTIPLSKVALQFDQQNIVISSEDNLNFQQQLISYLTNQITTVIQERNVQMETKEDLQLVYVNEMTASRNVQSLQNVLILRQIILTSIQNNDIRRNIKDLSTIIINYPKHIQYLNENIINCFIEFDNQLNSSTNTSNQVIISLYVLLFIIFVLQLLVINKLFRQRKLILKLFTRTDYKEALLESEKFSVIQNTLRNLENIWLSKNISVLLHSINQKSLKDDDDLGYQQKQSDRGKTIKSEKIDNFDNVKFKISISHQLSNLLSLLIIIGITVFTFVYIISFHVQIVNSSQNLDQYSFFSQILQQFYYDYLNSYSNCQYQMMFQMYKYQKDSQLLQQIYEQNQSQIDNLSKDLDHLNTNEFNTILLASNQTDIQNILQMSDENLELFFQGYLCQVDESICYQENRDLDFQSELLTYYNKSEHQLLLQQGQVFYQNSQLYNENDPDVIMDKIEKIMTSSDYFLNNIWGFDIINQRISNSIIYLTERMTNNVQQSGNSMFLFALILGVFYFFITLIALLLYGKYSKKQNQIIRHYLIQVPFATILKKNIYQQLKFID